MKSIDRLMTLESAAHFLRLQPSTLRRWVKSGRISGHRLALPESVASLSSFPLGVLPVLYFRPSEIIAALVQ